MRTVINFAQMPPEERVLYLAGLEVDGKPRFPMLRRDCSFWGCSGKGQMTLWDDASGKSYKVTCINCQGRGWLTTGSLEALMEAADTVGSYELRNVFISKHGRFGVRWIGKPIGWSKGVTPAEALSLAICKAVEGEK